MAPKKRLRMRGVKLTPKRLEEEILDRSNKIREDPGLLRPMCAGNCRKCAFDKPFKNIAAVLKYKDRDDVLLKYASKGSDDLMKAYAGTISLAAAGKIPMLATATIAGEKVPFAVRGLVGNDKLIGCQYYTDPKLRLMYYNNFIKKNKLHLYSFDENLVCSNSPNTPIDYLYDVFWETPYEFEDDGLDCGHHGTMALEIHIKSLDETIHICEDCAKEVSTIQFLISRICALDPLDDIEVRVSHNFYSEGGEGNEKIEGDELKKYLSGNLNDRTLLMNIKKSKMSDLKGGEITTYIIGEKNYGSDLEEFMGVINGSDLEKNTVKKYLQNNPTSIVLKHGKISEIINEIWEQDWRGLIAVHTSQEMADGFDSKPRTVPTQVLEDTYNKFISADVVGTLPEFVRPKQYTKLIDNLAKAAKVNGLPMVLDAIKNETLKDMKMRSIAAAFIWACDENKELPVKLTADETEMSKYLTIFAKQAIGATGEEYRSAVNTLLTACSSGESV